MKLKLCAVLCAATLCCLPARTPADPPRAEDAGSISSVNRQPPSDAPLDLSIIGDLEGAPDLIGTEVRDLTGRKAGKVKEIAIDLEHGRVVEFIVSVTKSGAQKAARLVAVPTSALTRDATGRSLRLELDREKLESAPEFKMSDWTVNMQEGKITEVYRHFDRRPYYFPSAEAPKGAHLPGENVGYVERAGKILGMEARSTDDQKTGKVKALIVAFRPGRVVEAVLSSPAGFLGLGHELSGVPPDALHFDLEHRELRLSVSKLEFRNAPHFKPSEWSEMENPVNVAGAYHAYKLQTFASTPEESALGPLDQSNSPADRERTAEIRRGILAREGLSVNAFNVKIISIGGKVALRGPVDSDEEKRVVGEIASRIAGRENVANQLEVKSDVTNR